MREGGTKVGKGVRGVKVKEVKAKGVGEEKEGERRYRGTTLNGHPSTADTHDIPDHSESPDHFSIDFNTLETPE